VGDLRHACRSRLPWWIAACLIAGALKRHYSLAGVAELDWMLRPVALLLQVTTGHRFQPSVEGEWYSEAAGILLVKGCAGINFMIMSFVGWCWLVRPSRFERLTPATLIEWPALLGIALVLAWAAAVLVNVLRILAALAVGPELAAWLGAEQAHRLLGLLIYLSALTAQLVLGERRNPGPAALVAVATYVGLMLVTPLLTGRALANTGAFAGYALLVVMLAGPLGIWGLVRARRDARLRERRIEGHFRLPKLAGRQ
jgi:exosortase K